MAQGKERGADRSGTATPTRPRRIIGYYASWESKTKRYTPADIPAELLTHVNYAFGLIDSDGRAMLGDAATDIGHADPSASDDLGGNFLQLKQLKERHPDGRTLISIGGWTGSGRFSDAVATERKRRAIVASCVELFLTRWPGVFDGIDIDWEYPVCCGMPGNSYRPEDRQNCTLLFGELRRQLDALGAETGRRYLLTAAMPAGRKLPVGCFELRESAVILDWINVMTYDMDGSERSGVTNFNAPFRPTRQDLRPPAEREAASVEGTVRVYEEQGVPRERIVVGVPFYGRDFTGVPAGNNGLYQPFAAAKSVAYHAIAANYLPTYQRFRHPEADVPWLYDARSGTMLSYDDPASIARKTDYVIDEGLGGIMVWEISGDTADRSLLTTISSRLRA
jgi:chitinase